MKDLIGLLSDFPEINASNYGDDEVNALNAWGIAAHTALEQQAEEITKLKESVSDLRASTETLARERNDLQSKLSAMESVEPVGFISPHDLQMLSEGYPRTVVMLAGAKHTEALYTAPKGAQPLSEEERSKLYRKSALKDQIVVRSDWEQGVRDAEAAHNIGGQQP